MQRREFLSALGAAGALFAADDYALGPDSQRQPGVPKGTVTQMPPWKSTIFPGTVRDWWIYVPSQYKSGTPAAVTIVQDGGGWVKDDGAIRMPIVLDNLIHKGDVPVMIGIFINPGVLPALNEQSQARYNRSFEYDAVNDRYARFLIDEILPEVRKQYTLSTSADDYCLAGSSSGASCAFTAAWHRPDQFHRVLSWIGSYTNLRGAEVYPDRIRKTEPRPLRVFMQDGKRDNNIYAGNWFIANQDVASALEYAGYDAKLTIGEEAHNSKHGASILPDSLRWLWREYPKPIAKPRSDRQFISTILDPVSEWQVVSTGHRFTEGPSVDRDGSVYFTDIPNNRVHRVDASSDRVTVFREDSGGANGTMFGPDGRMYACQNGRRKVVAWTLDGTETVLADDVNSNDICVTARGDVYFTEPPKKRVWLVDRQGNKRVVIDKGIEFPNGVRLCADQSLLLVVDYRDRWVWSYQIQPDGSVANGAPFYRLETPDDSPAAGDGMTVDSEGFLYVATSLGVQVCDQPGRVNGIIDKPQPGALANVVFGGHDLDWLYATAGDKVFKRHLRRKGVVAWAPVKPSQPRL